MAHDAAGKMMRLAWNAASSPAEGEDVCGDAYVVRSAATGYVLAVADGLGHGSEAAVAADAAIAAAAATGEDSPAAVLRRCHMACRGTRGVVMTVVHLDLARMNLRWAGVGNVEAVLVRSRLKGPAGRETAMLPGGVIGIAMPELREQAYDVQPGDLLALTTDGIRGDFVDELVALAPPADVGARIIDRHRVTDDDALVLIARCEAER